MLSLDDDSLLNNTILLAVSGSRAYGTSVEGVSDQDYKGICVPPLNYYFGIESFSEFNNTGASDKKNTKDDTDITIKHIVKFAKEAMSGVPSSVELLFERPEDYLILTDCGKALINNRNLFLSKAMIKKMTGYAKAQIRLLDKKVDENSVVGYNTKNFMHAVRLITSATEILNTKNYSTYRPNRNFLLSCRKGEFSHSQAQQILSIAFADMIEAEKKTSLPDSPDRNAINTVLTKIEFEHLKLRLSTL